MSKKLVYGNEIYLKDLFRKELREKILYPELNYLETYEFGDREKDYIRQYPCLSDRKILTFTCKDLNEASELIDFAEKYPSVDIYVFAESARSNSKLMKKFDEVTKYDKLALDVLTARINQYIKNRGCKIEPRAFDLFLQYTDYHSKNSKTNLYDVINSLDRLCSEKSKLITVNTVEEMVVESENADVYKCIHLIMRKQMDKLFRQADIILLRQKNDVIGVLSLLLYSYRIAYKMKVMNCTAASLGVSSYTFTPNLSLEKANEGMNILLNAINDIMTGRCRAEIILKVTFAKLCV